MHQSGYRNGGSLDLSIFPFSPSQSTSTCRKANKTLESKKHEVTHLCMNRMRKCGSLGDCNMVGSSPGSMASSVSSRSMYMAFRNGACYHQMIKSEIQTYLGTQSYRMNSITY